MSNTIGYVTRTETGNFEGKLNLIGMKAPLNFIPQVSRKDDEPDYRLYADGVEVGAAWVKIAKASGREYVSGKIDHVQISARPLYFNLGRAPGQDNPDDMVLIAN